MFLRSQRAPVTEWVNDVVGVVAGLQAQVAATPSRLLVALFPDQLQIDAPQRDAILAGAGFPPADFDADGLTALLRSTLTARGVAVVDVTPALAVAPHTPRLYRRQDVHWTIAGNTIAAQAVLAALTDVR